MSAAKAHAKINLALVVGPRRRDGMHEVATVLQRIELHDDLSLEPAPETSVEGFPEDSIVRAALDALARAAHVARGWAVRLEKRIPVAAGLGGGSADAAAALELANATLDRPLEPQRLHAVAAELGADVPFFLRRGAQLATGDGTELEPLSLPKDYAVLLVLPNDVVKESTRLVYETFDRGDRALGFRERLARLHEVVGAISDARGLAALPPNDLASSPLAGELRALGALRADVSGAGPMVYGLFDERSGALRAEEALRDRGRTFVTHPV
jgi:4-diphosphocytidyl-2-C-methyl-D-erythritol kinase